MEKYKKWVRTATINQLMDALIDTYNDYQSAKEDYEVYEYAGSEIEEKYYLVCAEIRKRAE